MNDRLGENRSLEAAPPADVEPEKEPASYAALVLPIAVSILLVTLIFFFLGGDVALELVTTGLATATVLGKFVVLRGLHAGGFFDSPYKLIPLIIYLDLATAFIAIYNMGILHRIPRLGAKIQELQANGKRMLERNPWMRKVTFLGIVAFVMFPLSGTGAIGGALFGRLLGLSRLRTLLGIGIGALLGGVMMAALADLFGEQLEGLQGNPALLLGGIGAVAVVGYWLYRRYRAMSSAS